MGQGDPALFHEIGTAHGYGGPADGAVYAAVLVIVEIVGVIAEADLLEQRGQLTAGGTAQGLGIGQSLVDLLAVYLQTVELHRAHRGGGGALLPLLLQGQDPGGEQVLVRYHHPAGGGDGPGTLPA